MTRFILPWVAQATQTFVHADDVREAMSLALVSGKHLIMFGPGGHAKSEMITNVTRALAGATTFVQSFGEGMDEARLYGGLDLPALEAGAEARIQYRPEHSFLAADIAVFEELFDSPASVLLSLKDTLTSGALRNGAQQYKMVTSCIVSATNRSPQEVADLGPAAGALIERFPLQLEVDWPSYAAADYLNMFRSVASGGADVSVAWGDVVALRELARSVQVPDSVQGILAEVISGAVAAGHFISPRTAMHALGLVRAAAAIRGSDVATKEDLVAIRYLPGLGELAAKMSEDIEAAIARAEAEAALQDAEGRVQQYLNDPRWSSQSPIKALQLQKMAISFVDELATLRLPDGMAKRREALRTRVGEAQSNAAKLAVEWTRI